MKITLGAVIGCDNPANQNLEGEQVHNVEFQFKRPAIMELHKQETGEWLPLPPEPPPFFKRVKNIFVSESDKATLELFANGRYLGRPNFKKAR